MNKKLLLVCAVGLIIIGCAIFAYVQSDKGEKVEDFVIIHTNDSHCHYDDENSLGFSTVAALREQYSETYKTVFTIDAGDFMQGNAYGTLTHGEASVELMSTVGYDLGIIGNHDFDFGLDVLMERVSQIDYPIICANLINKDTGESILDEYVIIERNGMKYGFFGLLTTETAETVAPGLMRNSEVTDPVAAAERMVALLEKKNVDRIICVGHLGVIREGHITSDEVCNKVPGIDIFIDGHSHTEMEDGKVCEGSIILDPSDTVIASTGCHLNNVGVVISDANGISAKLHREPPMKEPTVDAMLEKIHSDVDKIMNEVIGSTELELDGSRANIRNKETNLGDFITDSMRIMNGADVAFINAGAIRASIQPGDITMKMVYDVLPYQNYSCVIDAPGKAIWDEVNYSLSYLGKEKGAYLQFSGLTVTYDPDAPEDKRAVSIKIGDEDLDLNKTYKVATIDFIASGGNDNIYFVGYPTVMNDTLDAIIPKYLEQIGKITEDSIDMGRLISIKYA